MRLAVDSVRSRWGFLLLLPVLAQGATPAGAQRVPQFPFPAAEGTAGVRFTQVTSLRELRDGTLLVGDRAERRLVHMVWDPPSEAVVGGIGDGPGEYRGVGWLTPLGSDTTIFTDSYSGRWNLLAEGTIVESRGEQLGLANALGGRLYGGDASGAVLGVRGFRFSGRSRQDAAADSLLLLKGRWGGARIDTIARLRGRGEDRTRMLPTRPGEPRAIVGGNPLGAEDQALMFPDGWIAVAYVSPYRVDWRTPTGTWVRGPTLPFEMPVLTDTEKCAALERWLGQTAQCDPAVIDGWPERLPPFIPELTNTLFAAPGGYLVIARTPSGPDSARQYDVVSRTGTLVGVFTLPTGTHLVGFGARHAYTVTVNQVDLQVVSRHLWSPSAAAEIRTPRRSGDFTPCASAAPAPHPDTPRGTAPGSGR